MFKCGEIQNTSLTHDKKTESFNKWNAFRLSMFMMMTVHNVTVLQYATMIN